MGMTCSSLLDQAEFDLLTRAGQDRRVVEMDKVLWAVLEHAPIATSREVQVEPNDLRIEP